MLFLRLIPNTISIFVSRKKKQKCCDNRSLLFFSIEAASICICLMVHHPVCLSLVTWRWRPGLLFLIY